MIGWPISVSAFAAKVMYGVGVIVVWAHHVGLITGRTDGQWIVKSDNDGHAVRERPRSVAGAIAFRNPTQRFAGL